MRLFTSWLLNQEELVVGEQAGSVVKLKVMPLAGSPSGSSIANFGALALPHEEHFTVNQGLIF